MLRFSEGDVRNKINDVLFTLEQWIRGFEENKGIHTPKSPLDRGDFGWAVLGKRGGKTTPHCFWQYFKGFARIKKSPLERGVLVRGFADGDGVCQFDCWKWHVLRFSEGEVRNKINDVLFTLEQ